MAQTDYFTRRRIEQAQPHRNGRYPTGEQAALERAYEFLTEVEDSMERYLVNDARPATHVVQSWQTKVQEAARRVDKARR